MLYLLGAVAVLFTNGVFCELPGCGETPLHMAALLRDVLRVQTLLSDGADMYAVNCIGQTPMHYAILGNNQEVIEIFIGNNFELNRKFVGGNTVLQFAVSDGSLASVVTLVAHSASVDTVNERNETPMTLAVVSDSSLKIGALKGADLNRKDEQGRSYLHIAVRSGSHAALQKLLDLSIAPDIEDGDKVTPTLAALYKDDTESMTLLRGKGADLGWKSQENSTLLIEAAKRGSINALNWLLNLAVPMNDRDLNGLTALHYGVKTNNIDVVKLLLVNNMDPDIKDNIGTPSLQEASSDGFLNIVKALVTYGANVNAKTDHNWTALLSASLQGHLEVAKFLLDRGARIDTGDENGWTAMHCAALWGQTHVLKELVARGARIDPKDDQCFTPLHRAAWNGHLTSVQLLLENGADVNAVTADLVSEPDKCHTPLYYANLYKQEEVAEYIRSKGGKSGAECVTCVPTIYP